MVSSPTVFRLLPCSAVRCRASDPPADAAWWMDLTRIKGSWHMWWRAAAGGLDLGGVAAELDVSAIGAPIHRGIGFADLATGRPVRSLEFTLSGVNQSPTG